MKNMKRGFNAILVLFLALMCTHSRVSAYGSSNGAVVETQETYSEFGSLFYYDNVEDESMSRYNLSNIRNWRSSDNETQWIQTKNPVDGTSQMSEEPLYIELTYRPTTGTPYTKTTLEELKDNKYTVKFYILNENKEKMDVTHLLEFDEENEMYYYEGDAYYGYVYEITSDEFPLNNAIRTETVQVEIYHDIKINRETLSENQLLGKEPMGSWLDSKSLSVNPTPNYQNSYFISPAIDGYVKYQTVNEGEKPLWQGATSAKNVSVSLMETVEGEEIEVAKTTTDENGYFLFSNVKSGGTPYYITSSKNDLSIRINEEDYTKWIVKEETVAFELLNLARITDISRFQPNFQEAMKKTGFKEEFKIVREDGKYALDGKYLLTPKEVEEENLSHHLNRYVDEEGNELQTNLDAYEHIDLVGVDCDVPVAKIDGYEFTGVIHVEEVNPVEPFSTSLLKTTISNPNTYYGVEAIDGNINYNHHENDVRITFVYKKIETKQPIDPVQPTDPTGGVETGVLMDVNKSVGLLILSIITFSVIFIKNTRKENS